MNYRCAAAKELGPEALCLTNLFISAIISSTSILFGAVFSMTFSGIGGNSHGRGGWFLESNVLTFNSSE